MYIAIIEPQQARVPRSGVSRLSSSSLEGGALQLHRHTSATTHTDLRQAGPGTHSNT